jgi:hypothetical protein
MGRSAHSSLCIGFIFLLAIFIGNDNSATAQDTDSAWPAGCVEGTLGTPGQRDYQMTLSCLPQGRSWNGNLLVYAHGFVNPQDPIALPAGELNAVQVGDQSLIQFILDRGYAFATTSYSRNGWAIEYASENLNALVEQFKNTAPASTENVLIVGGSEGGLVSVMQLEKFPDIYSGGLSLCGVVGGSQLQVQYIGNFRTVFDYFFPDVFNFGTVDIPNDAPSQWQNTYSPAIQESLQNNPDVTESLFQVTRAPENSSDLETSRNSTAHTVLGYNIFVTQDLVQMAGGNPFQNIDTVYSGSNNDASLNSSVERVTADPGAIEYLNRFYQPTGNLQRPLVTLHNLQDPNVPYRHELAYGSLVSSQGYLEHLTSIPVPGYGHCAFGTEEVLGAMTLLLARTESLPSLEDEINSRME